MDRSRRHLLKYGLAALPLGLIPAAFDLWPRRAGAVHLDDVLPRDWSVVWSDRFRTLSLRTGGPTYDGLIHGSGIWSASAPWYGNNEPRGWEGYGYDWFVDPTYPKWPAAYPKLGQFAITPEGLRIRAEAPTPEMAVLLPRVRGAIPWLSGQLNSYDAVRIKPPFYFRCRARMPRAAGTPWPAIWLMTRAKRPWPNDAGREFEIDVHEGFGDDDKLHSTLHWHESDRDKVYHEKTVVDQRTAGALSESFGVWGTLVMPDRITFIFDDSIVGTIEKPAGSLLDQHFGIILNLSAGLPWSNTPPGGGPHDMTVSEVQLLAPNKNGLMLHNVA